MVYVEVIRGSIPDGVQPGCGAILKYKVHGHAGYAEHGQDIVCAAASATIYTAAGALNKLCGAPKRCARERDGYFELTPPVFKDSDKARVANIILETTYIGFKQIEASYPEYLKVTDIPK